MKWAGHEAGMGEMRNPHRILVGKPEGKKSLRRPRYRWEDITTDLKEIGWQGVDWIQLAQNRDQWQAVWNVIMNLQVPYKAGNFLIR
jgi:hypothetical protein